MHPAADQGLRPHAAAHQVFPHGEWAGDAEERFGSDERNRPEMQVAKPGISHPAPAERRAEPDDDQAADNIGGYNKMQNQ